MATVSGAVVLSAPRSVAVQWTAATQVWISIEDRSLCHLKQWRIVRCRSPVFPSSDGRKEARNCCSCRALTRWRIEDDINRRWKKGTCRTALPDDAPFALAIGASILSTLILPVVPAEEDNEGSSLFGPDDVRSGAEQIISFIPLFNWLAWVFAWLDTRQPRYLAYSAVYLAPYLKTGLSISPEDSWLPIASLLACIVHVQLDISFNAEGAQPPLGDMSKILFEETQIKDLLIRAEGLVGGLKELAVKSDSSPMDSALDSDHQEDDQTSTDELKTIEEEALKKEFAEWDAKFSKSKALEESAKDVDS